MVNFFSKKKKTAASPPAPIDSNAAIIKLRQNLDLQDKREAHLKLKMAKLAAEAKEKMAKGDKRGAVYAMKKRKMHDAELAKIENVKMTLETQAISLEGAAQNMQTMDAMKSGNSTLKSIRKAFGIDKVDELLDDVRDEMEAHQEVDHAFSQPIDPFMMADEDELMAELNALAGEDTKMSIWPVAPSRPIKTQTPTAVATNEPKKSMFALFA